MSHFFHRISRRRRSRRIDLSLALNADDKQLKRLIKIWALRLLVEGKGWTSFIKRGGYEDDRLADLLNLEEGDDFDPLAAKKYLFHLYQKQERKIHEGAEKEHMLEKNIAHLGEIMDMSADERDVIRFSILASYYEALHCAIDYLNVPLEEIVAVALKKPLDVIGKVLHPKSSLMHSGILRRPGKMPWDEAESLSPQKFSYMMISKEFDLGSYLEDYAQKTPNSKLTLEDYPHLQEPVNFLREYLSHAMQTRRQGVNILLYGPPGTGKTELTLALSHAVGGALFEIVSDRDKDEFLKIEDRMSAYKITQALLQKSRQHLVLFDEIEVLLWATMGTFGRLNHYKHSINKMLESNPIPAFWVSNGVSRFDTAFTRRFDMCLEVPIPPRSKRIDMMRKASSDKLDKPVIQRLAANEHLAPAVITRAVSVCAAIGADSHQIEALINQTLDAQGHSPALLPPLPEVYNPDFVNTISDLRAVGAGLKKSGQGRLCFYGAPGTGKTAYAAWLADQLDRELLIKRASDLLSPFVGVSEQLIHAAFRQARASKAILLIDEADSFLFDRRGAVRSWETSMVNEMLTQMECFTGIFIASTNLMDGLDQASLRRFDVKVKFDYLLPQQAQRLFLAHCETFGFTAGAAEQEVMRLPQLTPGDFAVARRQRELGAIHSAEELLKLLREECMLKEGGKAKIGFA